MEERNMELDDDGKIKLKKTGEDLLADPAPEDAGDDIVIEVPDFENFRQEDGRVGLSDEELAAKAREKEERAAQKKTRSDKRSAKRSLSHFCTTAAISSAEAVASARTSSSSV